MKKFIYMLVMVFMVTIGINEIKAESLGRCVYEYNGVKINVEQVSNDKAKINLNQDGALLEENVSFTSGKRTYTYETDLKSDYFFSNTAFYCPKFNILITNNKFSNDNEAVKIVFSGKNPDCTGGLLGIGKNCDTAEIMNSVASTSDYDNTCNFPVDTGNGKATLTVKNKGNGKVSYVNDDGNYKAKIKIDESTFFTNGIFNCDNAKVIAEICKDKTGNENWMYWKSSTDKKYCDGLNLSTGNEITVPFDPNTPSSSTDTSDEDTTTSGETIQLLKKIYKIIKILIPVLIVLLSTIDFLKVVLLSDEKDYSKAWNRFVKRIVVGIIFFIVPVLVSFLLKYSGIDIEQSFLQIFI